MKKENFVSLILGTIGGMFFAIGMCMCLIPEWNAFNEGLIMGTAGIVILLVMFFIRRKMLGKPPVKFTKKGVLITLIALAGSLTLGIGMCMCMVWDGMLVKGIIVGTAGIIILLTLIPAWKGIK